VVGISKETQSVKALLQKEDKTRKMKSDREK
jgi:hypothetical protein